MPDRKCLYKKQMEWADSNASMAKTSRNKDSAVGKEQDSK